MGSAAKPLAPFRVISEVAEINVLDAIKEDRPFGACAEESRERQGPWCPRGGCCRWRERILKACLPRLGRGRTPRATRALRRALTAASAVPAVEMIARASDTVHTPFIFLTVRLCCGS